MRTFTFGILAALAVLLCSCSRPEGAASPAVVVDLDAVARAMGRDRLIDRRVEQATQALNAKLLEAAASMEKELKKQQADIGTAATDEQRAKLKQTAQKIQENIQNNREVAAQARQRFRLEEIQRFRNEIKAVAAPIAEKHRASMVVVASQDILWFKPSADITATVIAEIRSQAGAAPSAEAEKARTGETNSPDVSSPDKETAQPANTNR